MRHSRSAVPPGGKPQKNRHVAADLGLRPAGDADKAERSDTGRRQKSPAFHFVSSQKRGKPLA